MLMIVVVGATGPVPGLRWDRLQVWEGSAAHDAWSRVDAYVAFRSYVLGCLGDLGLVKSKLKGGHWAAKRKWTPL